jgi:hypothetical protein
MLANRIPLTFQGSAPPHTESDDEIGKPAPIRRSGAAIRAMEDDFLGGTDSSEETEDDEAKALTHSNNSFLTLVGGFQEAPIRTLTPTLTLTFTQDEGLQSNDAEEKAAKDDGAAALAAADENAAKEMAAIDKRLKEGKRVKLTGRISCAPAASDGDEDDEETAKKKAKKAKKAKKGNKKPTATTKGTKRKKQADDEVGEERDDEEREERDDDDEQEEEAPKKAKAKVKKAKAGSANAAAGNKNQSQGGGSGKETPVAKKRTNRSDDSKV